MKLQEHLAPSGHMNVFLLSWTSRHIHLALNDQPAVQAVLDVETPDAAPSYSSMFTWVIRNPLKRERANFQPLVSPINWATHVRRGHE